MTDETQFPEEVRAKLAEIDDELESNKAHRDAAKAEIDRLNIEHFRYLQIRGAIWSTAEMCMRALMPPDLARQVETLGQDSLLPPERRRRDIRGEVLAFVTNRSPCGPVSYIAAGLVTSVTSVERALAWHERDGRLIETNGVWRVASADTPPSGAGTEAAAATVPASSPGLLVVDSSMPPEQFGPAFKELRRRLGHDDPPPVPSADRVLDFVTRAGEIGVSEEQLSRIGATPSIMNILSHNETAALGDDGRWRALPPGGDEA